MEAKEKYTFSVVVPVYNRPDEVDELLNSLSCQSYKDFEIIIVEDGSSISCKDVVEKYSEKLDIRYFFKSNSGPGDSRNFGMTKAKGAYIVLFDSDCIIPEPYFEQVNNFLSSHPLDCYGGPDAAHPAFSSLQKAISYAMTSFFTTGGIRGRKKQVDQFQPRSFNMGIRKSVIDQVGGFSDIHPGEDPDLSYRIMQAGYLVGLIPDAYVYHKRRIDFSKFSKQVYKFGVVRVILGKWHGRSLKIVYFFPTFFLLGSIFLMLLVVTIHPLFLIPLLLFGVFIFFDALLRNKNLTIAIKAVAASFIQLWSYGWGFLKSYINLVLLKRPERQVFPDFFFKKN